MTTRNPLIVVALSAALLLAGCVGTQGDADLESNAVPAELTVAVEAENVGDVSHLGLELDRVLAHDANVSLPDGFHPLDLQASHADVVTSNGSSTVEIASGTVPAGTYDQILIRAANATVEANASGGGHGGDGHAHDHGSGNGSAVATGSFDLPLNVSFEVTPDQPTQITFTLDVDESFDGDSLSPEFVEAEVVQGNETVATQTDLETRAGPTDSDLPSDPPATRIAVYAPNGDKVYAPPFDPSDGTFVNSESSAFLPGKEVRFTGTESEAVAEGAAIESYSWDFGDGNTDTGQTVSHAYEKQGVFEVELEVTDSYGNTDTHMVRVVILQTEWTTTLVEQSFEDGEGEWTTSSSGSAPSEEAETTWALDGSGFNSSAGWHVGHHNAHPRDEGAPAAVVNSYPGYTSSSEATLTSPTFTIPENWTNGGYSFYIAGGSESGFDPLEVTYTIGANQTETAATVDTAGDWTKFEDLEAFSNAAGQEVTFQFTFTSDGNTEQGPGFYMDAFVIGGVDIPMENAHLLEDAGGGHDHGDHSH